MKTAFIVATILAVFGGLAWVLYPSSPTTTTSNTNTDEVARKFLESARAAKKEALAPPKAPDLFR